MFWKQFQIAEPFPHLVLDDFLPDSLLHQIEAEFEQPQEWIQYNSPDERGKRTCNKPDQWGATTASLLRWLASDTGSKLISALTGITDLHGDSSFYGGGLHVTEPNGYLGLHLDNEIHPTTQYQRRLNLIIYCSSGWKEEWGGEFELWDCLRQKAIVKIPPIWNRAVLFETSNRSFHGHTNPVSGPMARKSLALYYWTKSRVRALFVARECEQSNELTEQRRLMRSM